MSWRAWGLRIWRYSIPVFMIGSFLFVLLRVLTTDKAPVGQAPTDNYLAAETRTRVVWEPNGLTGKFEIQVIPDEGSWDLPAVKEQHDGTHYLLPKLDPGVKYRWRVIHVDSGVVSNELTFRSAPNHILY